MSHGSDSPAQAGHSHDKLYLVIGVGLALLTSASWFVSEGFLDNRLLQIMTIMGVATVKALLVATFFMHLKFEGRWKWVMLAPTVVLAIVLVLALFPDIAQGYKP